MPSITQATSASDNYPAGIATNQRTFMAEALAAVQAIEALGLTKTAADGSAGAATAETVVGAVGAACVIGSVKFTPAAALTADNANYATILVQKRTAGGAPVTIATVTTQITGSGNWAQWSPVAIPVVAGAVAAGDAVTYSITKTGTGVVVPAGVLALFLS